MGGFVFSYGVVLPIPFQIKIQLNDRAANFFKRKFSNFSLLITKPTLYEILCKT